LVRSCFLTRKKANFDQFHRYKGPLPIEGTLNYHGHNFSDKNCFWQEIKGCNITFQEEKITIQGDTENSDSNAVNFNYEGNSDFLFNLKKVFFFKKAIYKTGKKSIYQKMEKRKQN